MKITPAFFSSSLKVVATETESNTASTATRPDANSPAAVAVLADAGENLLLLQRNAEPRIGLQDLRIDLVEAGQSGVALRRGVVVEILVVDLRIVHARPGRLLHAEPAAIGLQPPLGHPFRLVLLRRDEADDVLVQPLRREVGLDVGREAVFVLVDVERPDLRDRLLNSGHQTLLKSTSQAARLWRMPRMDGAPGDDEGLDIGRARTRRSG